MAKQLSSRRSIRLIGYDYSQSGLYFITICIQNRSHLLGKIENQEMIFNDAGLMVKKWYYKLEDKFKNVKCHEMIIMPNHFHCIIEITVGANLRVCPHTNDGNENKQSPKTAPILGSIVQWFKTMTTNEYIRGVKRQGWTGFNKRLWQRNYWEHIVRNEKEYQRIGQYIIDNPKKWNNDKLNDGEGNNVLEPLAEYGIEKWMV